MEKNCEYCDSPIPEGAKECPECGAPVDENGVSAAPGTIEELKAWYAARKLPPYETTRFFIGIDYKKPRAFGIYEENGIFTVYKNKNDGSRAVRYCGPDEAHAVRELYEKLKDEIRNQKSLNEARRNGQQSSKNKGRPLLSVFTVIGALIVSSISPRHMGLAILLVAVPFVIYELLNKNARFREKNPGWEDLAAIAKKAFLPYVIAVVILSLVLGLRFKTPSYYSYDGDIYCNYGGEYYLYNYYDYFPIDSVPYGLTENPQDYKIDSASEQWDSRYDFKTSDYYGEHFDTSSDSDSDWSSSDSWDSGGTDFDSDW